MRILVGGATGLIGSALVPYLKTQGHTVFTLVRHKDLQSHEIFWDPMNNQLDTSKIQGFDVIINLAGENIAEGRWTPERKERIIKSRVNSTLLLSQAIANLANPPKVFINASAIGFYGNKWDLIQTEESPKGVGFLAELSNKWEAATQAASQRNVRVVLLRTGVVLADNGGVLGKMVPAFNWYMGGVLGGGAQYISWITIDDLVRAIDFIIRNETLQGPINLVTPNPVTNEEFTKTLGKILDKPTFMHMPEIVARIAFGEMADEMMLSSTRVKPEKLKSTGFQFEYPKLEEAIRHILKHETAKQG